MPGSWIKAGQRLIQDLRETVRLHRGNIDCAALPLDLFARPVYYELPIPAEVYGGELVVRHAAARVIHARLETRAQALAAVITAQPGEAAGIVIAPPVTCVPAITQPTHGAGAAALLRDTAIPATVIVPPVVPPKVVPIQAAQWRLSEKPVSRKISATPFQKLRVFQAPPLPKTAARQLSPARQTLPLERKPIPPHRFAREKRERFRTALAQAVGLPETEIHIVGVYDRVYLGLFQSVSQSADGTLVCQPKQAAELDKRALDMPPVYLVIGRSDRQPNRTFRAVLPMTEVAGS